MEQQETPIKAENTERREMMGTQRKASGTF
jgi:hypothetical protein